MVDVALVSCLPCLSLDQESPLLKRALADQGIVAHVACWDDPHIDWSRFQLAVLRTTWNYHYVLQRFLSWVERASSDCRLLNPPQLVSANVNKRYLAELARNGVSIVPTRFVDPGESVEVSKLGFIEREVIIKPAVSAGSENTFRLAADDSEVHRGNPGQIQRSHAVDPAVHGPHLP